MALLRGLARPSAGVGLMHFVGLIVREDRRAEGSAHTCAGTEDATLSEMGALGGAALLLPLDG